jgi:NAD(P)-dependent dehydrogenase (short-subunit alcohol dehydrogenase family)
MTTRVVVISGASSGLGAAMTSALLEAGHAVAGIARDISRMATHARLLPLAADIRNAEECERAVAAAVAHFGTVDGIINNAGIALPDARPVPPFYDVTDDQWADIIRTNLVSPFFLTRRVARRFVTQGWGRIVNISTSLGTMTRAGYTPYGPSKAGLEAATAAWAADLRDTGVTVNVLVPGGVVDVPRISAAVYPDRAKLLNPGVMCAPACWLLSDASADFTGMRIIAKDWQPGAPDAANIAAASARA